MAETTEFVDPEVSRAKFQREIQEFRALSREHGSRGCWLVEAEFPVAFLLFGTPNLKPPALVFAAVIDFTNYDFEPLSVRIVNPFTREPYLAGALPTIMKRSVPAPVAMQFPPGMQVPPGAQVMIEQPLMMGLPGEVPFLCIPGVREYHAHPGHTGDSWLLHRGTGEGTLHFIVEQLLKYGSQPITGYQIRIGVAGFQQQATAS